MNGSANKIRKVVIPITWAATIVSAVGYAIYGISVNQAAFSQLNRRVDPLALLSTAFITVGIVYGGFILTVLWSVLADWIDNLSEIAKNTSDFVEFQLTKPFGNNDLYIEALEKKQRELVRKFRQNDLTYDEKAALYNEISKIDKKLKEIQQKDKG